MLNAVDSEAVILAWSMLDSVLCREVKDCVEKDFFYSDAHKFVFEAISSLMETGTPVDIITVSKVMRDNKTLGKLDDGLTGILKNAIVSEHFPHHLSAVRSAYFGRRIIQEAQRLAQDPENTDIVDCIQRLAVSRDGEKKQPFFDLSKDLPAYRDYIDETKNPQKVHDTGFEKIDSILGGARVGDLTTIAGRPGGGKTAMLLNIAMSLAERGNKVLVFSTEMGHFQVVDRIMPSRSDVFSYKFRRRQFDDIDIQRINDACADMHGKIRIIVDDNPTPGMADFRRDTAKINPDVVIIDYLQRCKKPRGENVTRATDQLMTEIKSFCLEAKVWTILGTQMNRVVDRLGEPTLSDLRDSGAIESESDQVILLHADGKREFGQDLKIKAIIGKNRHGACGFCKLSIDNKFASIEEIEDDENSESNGRGSKTNESVGSLGLEIEQARNKRRRSGLAG